MGNSEDSFYTFYFTFIKNLELSFLFLESKFCIIPQIDLRKVIKNFISFRVFFKIQKIYCSRCRIRTMHTNIFCRKNKR